MPVPVPAFWRLTNGRLSPIHDCSAPISGKSRPLLSRAPANYHAQCYYYPVPEYPRRQFQPELLLAAASSHLDGVAAVALPVPVPLPLSLITRRRYEYRITAAAETGQHPIFCFLFRTLQGLLVWCLEGLVCLPADLAPSAIRLAPPAVHCQYRNRPHSFDNPS